MQRILIVEDEEHMLRGLQDNLEFDDYQVDCAQDGISGQKKILENEYDLILLDVMLPHISGFDICKNIRKKGIQTPIILLTAKAEEIDKVRGLELGADDYITKPFSLRELLARIKAVLRRTSDSKHQQEKEKAVKIGKLSVHFDSYDVLDGETTVKMSHKEIEILQHLWKQRNRTVSRENLLDAIWGDDYQPTSRTVDNFIVKLRQKLETDPNNPGTIITVHGIGYKLIS